MSKGTFQQVIIIGNVGQDPEIRFTQGGDAVANLTIATSKDWKDKNSGEAKQRVEWHRVVIFGKLAEIAGEYVKKGSKVQIVGELQTRKWTNKQGQDQYTTEIVLQGFNGVMQMLDGKPQQQQQQSQQAPQQAYNKPAQQQGGYSQQVQHQSQGQQQGGFSNQGQQQPPKVNPQEPNIDFDDSPPF